MSNVTDVHADTVAEILQNRQVPVVRLNTETIGKDILIEYAADRMRQSQYIIKLRDKNVTKQSVRSVWYRRPCPPELGEYNLSKQDQSFAQAQWHDFLWGYWFSLENAAWMSWPINALAASNKMFQLQVAHKIGFKVPSTVVTSSADVIRQFYTKYHGKVIVKPLNNTTPIEEGVIYTNLLREEHLDQIDALAVCPVLCQEYIEKSYELRVTVVGNRVFAAKIDNQKSSLASIDWRRYDAENTHYSQHTLPESISSKCRGLVRTLGLSYGAIDLIREPEGEYVFLEINVSGQYLWIEKATGLPISEAIADYLTECK